MAAVRQRRRASMVAVTLGFLLLPESRPAPRRDLPAAPPVSAMRTLLQPAVLLRSALFGVVLTMSYIVLNFAVYWLPTVIYNEGYSVGDAGLIGSTRQLLTVALGFVVGFTMDRLGASRVLVVCHAAAMVLFMLVGGMSIFAALSLAVLLLGMSVLSAGLSGLLALVSASYDGRRCAPPRWAGCRTQSRCGRKPRHLHGWRAAGRGMGPAAAGALAGLAAADSSPRWSPRCHWPRRGRGYRNVMKLTDARSSLVPPNIL
ncbi:MAG: hypothetical protein IPM70_10555 [Proteobacteria bacterium]|nr:hypothetical protein [Pseudomonadota bacterium]